MRVHFGAFAIALLLVTGTACRPSSPAGSAEARSATLASANAESCRQACAQAARCGNASLRPNCEERCVQGKNAGLSRCGGLQDCDAFMACHAQLAPFTQLAASEIQQGCSAQCESLAQCQQNQACEAQRFAALEVPGCEAPTVSISTACLNACRQSGRPCAAKASCEELESCIESQLSSTSIELASSTQARPALQSEPNCRALCDRALRCGIEAAGANPQEQDALAQSLPAALLDSQTECLMQCQADYRSERRAEFEACLAQERCSDFIECSNEL